MKLLSKALSSLLLFAFFVSLTFFMSCSDDGDSGNGDDAQLVGTWTVTEATAELSVGGKSFLDYLVEEGGLTEVEAAFFEGVFTALLETEFVGAQIELKADNTYVAEFDDDGADTGTWSYNASTMQLTVTSDDPMEDPQVIQIKSTSGNTLVFEQSESFEEDIDDDGTTEEIDAALEVTMVKS